ncbi:MAG TPA: ABC transporter permease [Vicinamibacterales bacterium]|nr:ABC transporter permease [Vicinamibacterales bacterium]
MPDYRNRLRERLAAEGLAPSAHRDAVEEIAEHLNDLHRAAERDGQDANAVVDAELARMGSLAVCVGERAKRKQRLRPGTNDWAAGIVADVRQAVRTLRHDRSFSAIVVLTLAIGIGGCTAVFSIMNSLLLAPLPYPDPDRLVMVWETDEGNRELPFIVAQPVYEDWRRESRTLESIGIYEYRTYNVASDQEPQQVSGLRASASLFTVLGVPPAIGRVFTDAEDVQGAKVAVISDAVWRTHLGAEPTAIGRSLRLNGEVFEVIGVMPPGFEFPRQHTGVWIPMSFVDRDRERDSHSFHVAGRIRDGTSFETARAEIEQIGRSLQQRYEENADEGSTITLMSETWVETLQSMLTTLMAAVAMVLLIGCVNIANLQLGRALKRRREFVLRLSLGAGLGRLGRQLLIESLLLSFAGAAAGVLLAWFASRGADAVLSPGFRSLPFRGEMAIEIDATVLAFAAAVAVLSAALFGFAPLAGLRRREPATLLREGERGSTGIANAARRTLVAVEVALAIVVLSGAGLLIKSLAELLNVNPGLDPREVLTMQVSLPQENTYGPPVRESFCADLARSAEGLPGILSIAAISHLPLSGANAGRGLTIEGYVPAGSDDQPGAAYRLSCPGYFKTLGIPIIEGRDFNDRDVTSGVPVTIVNRATAERYWPGSSPIGKRLKIGAIDNDQPWRIVVGVAENARHFGLDSEVRREFYLPYSQAAWPVMTIVAKTVGDPLSWQTALREAVKRVDATLPVAQVRSMDAWVQRSVDWRETPMRLLTGFAIIGLLLASIGVYGVLAYYVSQRTREIGVRAALGATRLQLALMVIRQSMLPIAAGVIAGVAGSLGAGRLLQQFLFQVKPGDPQVIAIIGALLAAVGLLATWLPARKAAAIDPMVALRDE